MKKNDTDKGSDLGPHVSQDLRDFVSILADWKPSWLPAVPAKPVTPSGLTPAQRAALRKSLGFKG